MCSGRMAVGALGFSVCAFGCCRVVLDGCACFAAAAGVISVAVFGLYGAATSKFDISDNLEESGAFVYFWDTFAFVANGIVFFYAGASSVNFVIRSAALLFFSPSFPSGRCTPADACMLTQIL